MLPLGMKQLLHIIRKLRHRNVFAVHTLICLSTAYSETQIKTNVLCVPSRPLCAFSYELMTDCHEPD